MGSCRRADSEDSTLEASRIVSRNPPTSQGSGPQNVVDTDSAGTYVGTALSSPVGSNRSLLAESCRGHLTQVSEHPVHVALASLSYVTFLNTQEGEAVGQRVR